VITEHDQLRVGEWARNAFGPNAMDRRERAARVLEEALELAQAEGVTPPQVERLTKLVYSRPLGFAPQEIGGIGVTLLAWGYAAGYSVHNLIYDEITRVMSLPVDHFKKRHAEKVAAGVSLPRGD
jgi:hypothetical protein